MPVSILCATRLELIKMSNIPHYSAYYRYLARTELNKRDADAAKIKSGYSAIVND